MEAAVATSNASPAVIDATPDSSGGGKLPEEKSPQQTPAFDLKQKIKAKVNDKEEEVSVEELLKTYQLERAATQKFQKASEIEKNARKLAAEHQTLQKRLKENVWEVLEEQGIDPDEIAEKRLLKKLEFDMMSPEQKEVYKLRREGAEREARLKAYEQFHKDREEHLAREQAEQLKLEQINKIDTELSEAIAAKGLKATPAMLESAAQYMLAHLNSESGNKDITLTEALEYVLKSSETEFKARLEGTPIEKLVEILPKGTLDAIRKHFVNQVTSGTVKPTKSGSTTPPRMANGRFKGTTDDFFNRLEQKFR